ncbi:YlaC family protein [Pantoea sp.]|uniref:YlaC family protein n=1 Tax=Pantoea sp. TaxID=69393 RepID=UPI0028A08953|nr:YlaC family protein [Pantoea sp.]
MTNSLDQALQKELNQINADEKRNDRPFFDISFIKDYPGLYSLMCFLFVLTMGVLLYSDTFGKTEVVVCCIIFITLNAFFFFHIKPSYNIADIDKGAWKNCYTGDWYMEVHVREDFVNQLLSGNILSSEEKSTLQNQLAKKGYLYFADIYRLRHRTSKISAQ